MRDFGEAPPPLTLFERLKEGLSRFGTGMFAIWYPQLNRGDARQLPEKLKKLADDWLNVALTVRAPEEDGFGLHGSGIFVINPPWTLAQTLRDTLPLLRDTLGMDAGAGYSIETADEHKGKRTRPNL